MVTLENKQLRIAVKKIGAELCQITSVKNNTEFMWDANPNVWAGFAPNLFPIIGALKNDTYIFEDKAYKLPKHGMVRNNAAVALHEQTADSITFKLIYSEDTLEVYPFKFELYISYTLLNNSIEVRHTVKNVDDKPLYFSVGGHPAFKCPVFENEAYEDYVLEFEQVETSKTHLINMANGLISAGTKAVFNNSDTLPLTHDLFNEDALIFKDLKSKKVALKSKTHGEILSVSYKDFSYLGIWAKPTGDYVCIEPWLGIADSDTTNQDFKTKEGILKLSAGNSFKASYTIEIHNSLV
ncbi:aldose 1-epimerase family protein [Mariniflexile sp. AS56]|uniref:aldose 1-epimerase family protein n=1 Tax=Mariniflexile sp. AS56 TaxID=3063957 RepID=UPI0026EFB3D7|nr:aldose 1-epimerase family protein [Mariniflexile sp. AS56]MDO7171207.1 aldose 1-epimerase family protein [Mariniflexile sp. AS56]